MSAIAEKPLSFNTLYQSPLVNISDYNCSIPRGGPQAEEYCDSNAIVLMRHGAFCKHFGRKTVTATVNQSIFFSKGSTYQVSHPSDCGDRGTTFELNTRILNDIIRELDPAIDDRPDNPFSFITGPCDKSIFWRHRSLVKQLESEHPLEPLWGDFTAIQLVADVLEMVFTAQGISRSRHRDITTTDYAERTEAAKMYLAGRLGERITLDDIAREVHSSPFHFARIFRQQTGISLHRYLMQLRLRTALERLLEGTDDITGLALEVGFSSHSHFTETFRREFGFTPSEVRRRPFTEISKNLIV